MVLHANGKWYSTTLCLCLAGENVSCDVITEVPCGESLCARYIIGETLRVKSESPGVEEDDPITIVKTEPG